MVEHGRQESVLQGEWLDAETALPPGGFHPVVSAAGLPGKPHFSPMQDSSNGQLLLGDVPLAWSRWSQNDAAACGSSYAILHPLSFPSSWSCTVDLHALPCPRARHPLWPFPLQVPSWVGGCFSEVLN